MLERWKVEERRDPFEVEQVQLLGSASETDCDDRFPGKKRIPLPAFERNVGQNVVITDDDVRRKRARQRLCGIDSDRVTGHDAHFRKIPRYMLTEKAVTRDA